MSGATGALEWMMAYLKSLECSDFDPRTRRRAGQQELAPRPTVLRSSDPRDQDPESLVVTDSKALFDSCANDNDTSLDDRSALEMAVIRDTVRACRGKLRWIPHDRNPADMLTKMEGAHCEPMWRLLQHGTFRIAAEEEELMAKKAAREIFGRTPRPKTSWESAALQKGGDDLAWETSLVGAADSVAFSSPQRHT